MDYEMDDWAIPVQDKWEFMFWLKLLGVDF